MPCNRLTDLIIRVSKVISKTTPIIIIKTNVYDIDANPLKEKGYKVIDERIPFPSSGQQTKLAFGFKKALSRINN